jgi:arylsulfatase A-like enzyme
MISHIDHQVGRVLAALEASGQRENTLIVFAGDNGLAVGQHGLLGKQNHYDHSVRVPLLFSGPGVPTGTRTDAYAYLLDIFPTLCEYLQLDCPPSVEGRSLFPLFTDPAACVREDLYFAFTDSIRSVKDRRYKLIEYATERGRATQLFDLQEDPWEILDRSADPESEEIVARLRRRLLEYRAEWEDAGHPLSEAYWRRYNEAVAPAGNESAPMT